MLPFRERISLHERIEQSSQILERKPGYCPCILERGSKETPLISRDKFLVSRNLTVQELMWQIRNKLLKLRPGMHIFFLCNNSYIPSSRLMGTLYDSDHDAEDAFLYIRYTVENTFG